MVRKYPIVRHSFILWYKCEIWVEIQTGQVPKVDGCSLQERSNSYQTVFETAMLVVDVVIRMGLLTMERTRFSETKVVTGRRAAKDKTRASNIGQ